MRKIYFIPLFIFSFIAANQCIRLRPKTSFYQYMATLVCEKVSVRNEVEDLRFILSPFKDLQKKLVEGITYVSNNGEGCEFTEEGNELLIKPLEEDPQIIDGEESVQEKNSTGDGIYQLLSEDRGEVSKLDHIPGNIRLFKLRGQNNEDGISLVNGADYKKVLGKEYPDKQALPFDIEEETLAYKHVREILKNEKEELYIVPFKRKKDIYIFYILDFDDKEEGENKIAAYRCSVKICRDDEK